MIWIVAFMGVLVMGAAACLFYTVKQDFEEERQAAIDEAKSKARIMAIETLSKHKKKLKEVENEIKNVKTEKEANDLYNRIVSGVYD